MGELRTRATMDDRPFRAGVDRMDRSVRGFTARLSKIKGFIGGAFAIGGITAFARSVADLGSKISDMVVQTGVGARSLQGLTYATRIAGAEEQKMVAALGRIQDAMGTVLRGQEGSETLRKSFDELGVSMGELAGLSPDRILEQMAVGFQKSGRSAQAFSAIADIIGVRNAPMLTEVLIRLADEGLDKVAESAEKAGASLDERFLGTLDRVSDRMNEMSRRAKVSAVTVSDAIGLIIKDLELLPPFDNEAMDPFTRVRESVRDANLDYYTKKIEERKKEFRERRKEAEAAASQAIRDEVEQEAEAAAASLREFSSVYRTILDESLARVDPEATIKTPTSTVDSLTRIGGMLGGRGNNDMSRLIQEQQRIRSHVAAIQRDVERQKRVTIAEP